MSITRPLVDMEISFLSQPHAASRKDVNFLQKYNNLTIELPCSNKKKYFLSSRQGCEN